MGRVYDQLSLEERCEIARLRGAGSSIRQIAAALDRQPSSISRELKRNAGSGPRAGPYKPAYAQKQTAARRWSGSRLERDEALRETVLKGLAKGWSPELRPAEAHQQRLLASLSAARQGQTRAAGYEGRIGDKLYPSTG